MTTTLALSVALLLLEIDLTDRVRPYLERSRLHVKDARIPSGRHKIRVAIADTGGNTSTRVLRRTR